MDFRRKLYSFSLLLIMPLAVSVACGDLSCWTEAIFLKITLPTRKIWIGVALSCRWCIRIQCSPKLAVVQYFYSVIVCHIWQVIGTRTIIYFVRVTDSRYGRRAALQWKTVNSFTGSVNSSLETSNLKTNKNIFFIDQCTHLSLIEHFFFSFTPRRLTRLTRLKSHFKNFNFT